MEKITAPTSADPFTSLLPRVADAARHDAIDTYVRQQLNRLKVPGAALAIVEGDQIVHQRGFGQARPDGSLPSPQTPFFIGSLTKSFTALAVMQLVEAGKIELDAPVQRYLPWFRVADPHASAQITVRHLLNQTSGLPTTPGWAAMTDFDDRPDAGERQARALATVQLGHPVGSAFEYSNSNYDLLGLIIEAASGERYPAYIQHHIFDPLDMRHSYTTRAVAAQHGLAQGYLYWFGYPVRANPPFPRGSLPSGQLISSTEDLAHYLLVQMHGGRYGNVQVLSSARIAEMHQPAVEAHQGLIQGHYGMGWHIKVHGSTPMVWHDGVVPDFFAYLAILPEQNTGFVLLLNANHFAMVPALSEIGQGVASLLAGHQPAASQFAAIPWALRGLLVIPALQALEVALTLRQLRSWQRDPSRRPSQGRTWALHVMLPLLPNLLLATAPILLARSGLARFLLLFGPDFSRIALISGGFAGLWTLVRTGLVLRTLRRGLFVEQASEPSRRSGRRNQQEQNS